MTGCTFFADTDLPSAQMELGVATVSAYQSCNADNLVCGDGSECVIVQNDGIELANFCAPECESDDDCLDFEDTPGRCLLGLVGSDRPDRCVLACEQTHAGTTLGCPPSMICAEVQGIYLCL